MIWDLGKENALVIHLTLIPYLSAAGELKPSPLNILLKHLWKVEFLPILLCVEQNTNFQTELREKLALFCNVKSESIIQSIDVDTIYDVPLKMRDEGLDKVVLGKLQMTQKSPLI